MKPLQRQPSEVSRSAAPAAPVAASSSDGPLRCSSLGSRSGCGSGSTCPETWVGGMARMKRRRRVGSCSESTAEVDVETASAAAQWRVRSTQVKQFDPVTRRFVFLSFAQQLQQQVQHHVAPLHRTGALDLLQQQQIRLRHSAGCAGIQPMKSTSKEEYRKIQITSDLDYSAFRAMVQEYKFTGSPPRLSSLLAELQPLCSTLPLLLLERQRVVQLLLCHVVHEECCTVVLALLQALAKSAADAERLSLLFVCVSNLFRYLAKPLLDDFHFVLELYLPWLCGTVAVDGRLSRNSETRDLGVKCGQKQKCQRSRARVSPPPTDVGTTSGEESEASPTAKGSFAKAKCTSPAAGSKVAPSKYCQLSKTAPLFPEVQILAAQAFACLLRKAAADEDGGALFHCVHELMMCLNRCSPRSAPVLAEAFGRILFETVRGFHHSVSSSFDRLLRFLLACVLFQKPYKDAVSGVEFTPTACYPQPEPASAAHTVSEPEGHSGQPLSGEVEVIVTKAGENKRRKQLSEGEHSRVRRPDGNIADMEALCEETSDHTAEQAERLKLRDYGGRAVTCDLLRGSSRREPEAASTPPASSADTEESSCLFPYFSQVKCLETLLKLVRLHAGSMQSKAAQEVQALLLEFLAAALKANSAWTEGHITLADAPRFSEGTVKVQAASSGAEGVITTETCGISLSDASACADGVQSSAVEGPDSAPFNDFLRSSFLPYFYKFPAPLSLSSHPYIRWCGTWLFASEPGASSRQAGAFTHNGSGERAPSVNPAHPPLTTSARLKHLFFTGFGLISLFEFVGDWATGTPRLRGSFDDFSQRLLRVLAPYVLPDNSAKGTEVNSHRLASTSPTRRAGISSNSAILRPLVDMLRCGLTVCSCRRCVVQGMNGHHDDAAWLRLREISAAFAVIVPCALLRLIAVTWRATPKSFAAAISAEAPDLLKDLLLLPQKPGELLSQCCQQVVPFATRGHQDLWEQHSTSSGDGHATRCWRGRLGSLYLDCCVAFVSLLQYPELLAEPETSAKRVQGCVDGYALHALRPVFQFLVSCFSVQRHRVSISSAPAQRLLSSVTGNSAGVATEAFPWHPTSGWEDYVVSSSQWRGSASGVLLAEQLRTFWGFLRSDSATLNATACLRRGLDALIAALDELLGWISDWEVTSGNTPVWPRHQSEEAQMQVLLYAWGVMSGARSLLACLSAPDSGQSLSKTAGLPEFNEAHFLSAVRELQDRLLQFIFCLLLWAVKGLVGRPACAYKEASSFEYAGGDVGKATITTDRHTGWSTNFRQSKVVVSSDESTAGAEHTCRKLSMMYFQVVRQSVDCLFALAAGGSLSKGGIAPVPFLSPRHIARILQLPCFGELQDGDCPEGAVSSLTMGSEFEPIGKSTSAYPRNTATSRGQLVACRILHMLFRDSTSSGVPSEKSEDSMQSAPPGGELVLETLISSTGDRTQRDWGSSGAALAAARWVVLLLSIFNATDPLLSNSTSKPFLLPLLQCCLDCLQAFIARTQHQRIEDAHSGAAVREHCSRGTAEPAAELFLEVHGSSTKSTFNPAECTQKLTGWRIVEQGMTLLTAAVNASLPFLLPCLSSPCRSLRLMVARLLLHFSIAVGQLVPVEAPGCNSAVSTGLSTTRSSAHGQACVNDDASIFITSNRELFQHIVDLESTEIGLNEERRMTRLVEKVGQNALQSFQESGDSFRNHPEHRWWGMSIAAGNTWRGSCAPPLLLAFECAVRVLVAQFSVKFSPLWQAVDGLRELVQKAANVDKLASGAPPSITEDDDNTLEARSSDIPTVGTCSEHRFTLLSMIWRIVVGEVQRAEDELNELRAPAHRPGKRKAHVQQPAAQHRAEGHLHQDVHRSTSSSFESGAKGTVSSGGDATSGETSGAESTTSSQSLVFAAWRKFGTEVTGSQNLSENGIQEADALSRHTQLLRVVENIHRITFSGAYENDAMQIIRSPNPPEGSKSLPRSISRTEEQDKIFDTKEGGLGEKNGVNDETATLLRERDLPCTSLTGNSTKESRVTQSENLATARVVDQGNRARFLCLKHMEALERTRWTLSEALRLVGALTADAAEDWTVEVDDAHADETRRQKLQQDRMFSLSACGNACTNISHVSLIPRLCNVLRAVVALGTAHVTLRVPFSRKRTSVQPRRSSTGPSHSSGEFQGGSVGSGFINVVEDYSGLVELVSDLWSRLLACCAQRLISVADCTLQQLSLKVLQLSPTLGPRLHPYAPLLEKLIASEGISDILLRLRVKNFQQQGDGMKILENQLVDVDGNEERTKYSGECGVFSCDKTDASMQNGIVVSGEHKDTVLPLLVRLLLTKVQQRATKRSATSFSRRRTILSFISSIAADELPLVLAVLLHPLICVRKLRGPLPCEGSQGPSRVVVGAAEKRERGHIPVIRDVHNLPTSCNSTNVTRIGTVSARRTSETGLRFSVSSVPQTVISGFVKEELLRRVVVASIALRASGVRTDEDRQKDEAFQRTGGAVAKDSVFLPATIEAETMKCAEVESWKAVPESAAVIVEAELPQDGSLAAICLAPACLPPQSLARLRSCLETLKQLQELGGQLLRPAAPFLMHFYSTILQQLASRRQPPQTRCGVSTVATATTECANFTKQPSSNNAGEAPLSAEPLKASAKSVYEKAVVHSVLLLLRQLLHLFPDDAATWQRLLRPAAAHLQQLLEAAIATAAASPVYSGGPGKSDRHEKKSVPAIISLIASWAAHPAYHSFYTALLPHALSALFRVPAAPAVLRAVGLRHRLADESKRFCGRSLGVLDAAIDVALQLSSGSFGEDQQPGKSRGSHRVVAKERTRSRRRRDYGSDSSTSEAEDSTDEKGKLSGEPAGTLGQQHTAICQREQQELLCAAQYQRKGMTILRPYLPRLLKSLEVLFQHRSAAARGATSVPGPENLPSKASFVGVSSRWEETIIGTRCEAECGKRHEPEKNNATIVVRVKELQLLTRIAQFTVDEHEELQHPNGQPDTSTAQGGVSVGGATFCKRAEVNVACSLVRLLLQCLWGCSSRGGDARQPGAAECFRRILSLQALRRLTLPLAAGVRALREKKVCDAWGTQCDEQLETSEAAPDVLSSVNSLCTKGAGSSFTKECVERHACASDACVDVLRLTVKSCCRLLQESRSLQCRVATAQLLLAAELAACGLSHTDQLLNDVLQEINASLRRTRVSDGVGLPTLDGDAAAAETDLGLRVGDAVLDALLPGGSILQKFLKRAVALSDEKLDGRYFDPNDEETYHIQKGTTHITASRPGPDSGCGEEHAPYPEESHRCMVTPTPRVMSVLVDSSMQANNFFKDGNGRIPHSRRQQLCPWALNSNEEEAQMQTQWHIAAALILLCVNGGKSCGRRLAVQSGEEDEELPDSDTQIVILSSLAERCINVQVPLNGRAPAALGRATREDSRSEDQEVGPDTCALQFFNRSTLAAFAAEPLVRQCLYLLTSSAVEWSVQQVALNLVKRLVDVVVAAAAHCWPSVDPDCSSSCDEATSTFTSASACAATAAPPEENGSEKTSDNVRHRCQVVHLRQAVGSHAFGIMTLLAELVMPAARLQLKRSDEDQWRIGVQLIEHVVRSFAPVAHRLVQVTAFAECGLPAAFVWPAADTQRRIMGLQQLFNLDLASLMLRTSVNPGEQRSPIDTSASGMLDGTATATGAVQTVVVAASSRNAGGDFFIDLLHVQRHRRGRALQRMAVAAEAGLLHRSTLQTVCLPLCFGALLQRGSCATKQKQRSGRHRQLFHQGLCEQGLKCFEICCARVPWKRCLRVIQVLAGFLIRIPEREAYIYRAICGAVRAFKEHVKVARAAAGVTVSHTAGLVDSNSESHTQQGEYSPPGKQGGGCSLFRCRNVPQVRMTALEASSIGSSEVAAPHDAVCYVPQSGKVKQKGGLLSVAGQSCSEITGKLETASPVTTESVSGAAAAGSGFSVRARVAQEGEEEENTGNSSECSASDLNDCESNCEGKCLPIPPSVTCVSRLEKLQYCIRDELLPLLFRLSFTTRQTKPSTSDGINKFGTCSDRGVHERCSRLRDHDESANVVNPTLIVVCVLLMRLLPRRLFEEQLPRLVRLVALRLRSRNRDTRRQARGALVSIASTLGASFVPFLATELYAILRSTPTKSNKNQQDSETASTNLQAFSSSVLLFTLHAIVHRVLHPHDDQNAGAVDSSNAAAQRGRNGAACSGGTAADPRGSDGLLTDEAGSDTSGTITAGCLDDAFPVLLPLVAEELSRICDSDRLLSTASKTNVKSTKNDEARHLKGAALIYLLSSVCSRASCEELMVPFFSALLTGEQLVCTWLTGDKQRSPSHQQQRMIIRQRQGFSSAAAFSPAYLERIRELLVNFIKGLNNNTGLNANFKLVLSRRLLVVAVSIMQQQCLHPLRQLRCRRRELLELALAQQQSELHASRFASVPPRRWRAGAAADEDRSQPRQRRFDAEMSHSSSLDAGQAHLHPADSPEVVRKRGAAKYVDVYDETVEADMRFFRKVFLLAYLPSSEKKRCGNGAVGIPATCSRSGDKADDSCDETVLLMELGSHSETAHGLRAADFDRREALRMALATQKDRMMLTQPGAASGRSLEQAMAAQKTAKGKGAGGFDASSRAAAIGGAALRLLLLTLKKHKAELNEEVATTAQTSPPAKVDQQKNGLKGCQNASHTDTVTGDKVHQLETFCCPVELEKSVENVVCALCSTDNELIAWSARCLIYMVGLKLREVDRLGSVIAYSALRIFQLAGENGSGLQQKQHQVLVAPCTRLLALLLLRPQSSAWVQKALYGGRAIPRTHGEFLRQQMWKQAQHQVKVAAARRSIIQTAPFKQNISTERQALEASLACRTRSEQPAAQSTAASSDESDVRADWRQSTSSFCHGDDAYTKLQAQLLRAERDGPPVAAVDAKQQQVKFREALVAQIAHALENSQTRLSALALFKSVVLPHYREVAAEAVKGNGMEDSNGTDMKRSQQGASAGQSKDTLAGCWLLKEVYRCVDVIARLMIQEAGDSGEVKRLATLCADVYVHFLLNFPMTSKTQQHRVLFLIKNLGYATVDGRRAVLNCIHKILCRFPYELTVEKYSNILVVSLCRRLVLEEDSVTHSMLRMLVGQLMHISEDLRDGQHSCLSVLHTCAEVLLQPKVTNLLAIEELILIFIGVQAARRERRLPHKILPLLHRTIVLSEAVHNSSARGGANPCTLTVSACCGHGCCGGVDWRVCYKALVIFEKLILCAHPCELDRIFAKTALAVQQLSHSSHLMKVLNVDRHQAPSARLAEALYNCRYPGTDTVPCQYYIKGTVGVTDDMKNSVDAAGTRTGQDSGHEMDVNTSLEKEPTLDSRHATSAFALARMWSLIAGSGITHRHPWIRAVSLRCAGLYLGGKLCSGFSRDSPCLFYLPVDNLSCSVESENSVRRDSQAVAGYSKTEPVIEQGYPLQATAYAVDHSALTKTTKGDTTVSCFSNPGVALLLGALKSLGEDDFLEHSPHAVPAVCGLVIPLLKLTIERPDFFRFTKEAEVEAVSRESGVERHATLLSTYNAGVVRMAAGRDCDRSGTSPLQTGVSAGRSDAFNFNTGKRQREKKRSTPGIGITTETEENKFTCCQRESENEELLLAEKAKCLRYSSELQSPPGSNVGEHHLDEAVKCTDSMSRISVVPVSVNGYVSEVFDVEDDNEIEAVKMLAYQEDPQESAREDATPPWTSTLRTDYQTLRHRGSRGTGDETEGPAHARRQLSAFEEHAAAVATSTVCAHLQRSTCCASGILCSASVGGGVKGTAASSALSCSLLTAPQVSSDGASTEAVIIGTLTQEEQRLETGSDSLQTCTSACDCISLEMKASRGRKFEFGFMEGLHPLIPVVRKLSYWLRLHLGSLGKRDTFKDPGESIPQRPTVKADVSGVCGTVARIGAILAALQSIVYMVPLRTCYSNENPVVTGGPPSGPDGKKELEVEEKQLTLQRQNKLIPRDDSKGGDPSVSEKPNETMCDSETRCEMWVYRVILSVLETFFRCSTLVRYESSRQELSNKGEHLVKILAELQDHLNSGKYAESLYTETQDTKHHWEHLSALDPKEQQNEVVAAGAYLLDCLRGRMGTVGMEGVFLQLLAKVRGKVLRQRMERKVQLRQQALVRPQQFAERRRKRQKKKAAVRSAAVTKKKRQGMLRRS